MVMDEQNQLRGLFCKEFKMLGWQFWVSEKLNDYSTFHGQKSKPDILFKPNYVNNVRNYNLVFGLEIKKGIKTRDVVNAIVDQCPSYVNTTYEIEYNGQVLTIPLKHILLATQYSFSGGVSNHPEFNVFSIARFAWKHNTGLLLKRFGEWCAYVDNKYVLLK